jgi:hypothetical protein
MSTAPVVVILNLTPGFAGNGQLGPLGRVDGRRRRRRLALSTIGSLGGFFGRSDRRIGFD